jgi:hypothetical protein
MKQMHDLIHEFEANDIKRPNDNFIIKKMTKR